MTKAKDASCIGYSKDVWTEAVNALEDVVFIVNPDRKISDSNHSATSFLCGKEKNATGKCCHSVVHGLDKPVDNCPVSRMLESRHRETLVMEEGGRWYEVIADPIFDSEGHIKSAVHTMKDITEQVARRLIIEESEKALNAIVKSSVCGYSITKGSKVLFANETLLQMMGYKNLQEFLSVSWTDHIHPSDRSIVLSTSKNRNNETFIAPVIETRIVCKNGAVKYFKAERKEIEYRNETCFLSTLLDITLDKEMEDLKKKVHKYKAEALIGKVAGKMAHDFNNIMAIIMGATHLLISEELAPEIRQYVQAIKDTCMRGKDVTRNLMFFSKDQEPKLGVFNLRELIDNEIMSLGDILADTEVKVNSGENIDSVIGDVLLISCAISQLLKNAVHATAKTPNPSISITAEKVHGLVRITVSDNGCGIPVEHHDDIFEPTFTLKGSQDHLNCYTEKVKGSGYGLANVKKCVNLHKGEITFKSALHKGSTFTIEFPDIEVAPENMHFENCSHFPSATDKNILVVEDEIHFANVLCKTLANSSNNVDLATNGKMALEFILAKKYDIVSLDFMLPDMSGLEIYKRIRELDPEVPIVFVSGNFSFLESMIALKSKDERLGHLAKPFDNLEYINTLSNWIHKTQH